jgi:hypothetical protein
VHGEQAPARLELPLDRGGGCREGGVVEVVEDLGADDQLERTGGERLGQLATFDGRVREGAEALAAASAAACAASTASSSSQAPASRSLSTPIEQPTSSARA